MTTQYSINKVYDIIVDGITYIGKYLIIDNDTLSFIDINTQRMINVVLGYATVKEIN